MTERLNFHFSLSCIGEGNGNPLQCSCLENPRDGGAWWAAVSGAAQIRTRLKRLGSSGSRMQHSGLLCPSVSLRVVLNSCPWSCSGLDMTERLNFHFSLSCTGEGNGNPLQYSCLENPRDDGTWWAAVYGIAQSRTRLKRLSIA